ncbi:transcription antitermination protein NusB [Corynebacterium glutamicum MT]|uniref:Transcription antitermination protein NusB n=1 Tax=Corynebacterium glutamicum TaxID=1718 RepID=A0AB36IDZ0_CORGT|nr:transcription antitermination factor NusB [Corynebacterium glutamicum]AGN19344.1 transcription antitermination protein NusB [Corynebacterium glutamicum SCgG1]AGN22369.1 transcription antitermination protein NusB [Corynebacterium glutamicum SCgG2]EGV40609.1 transcription antitermination protein NusB [Corynebacterium glutamicum S9114]EOA65537.1 transcription antitermination protein NusB [Corynebacterium glutamicum MT]EPP40555.1 transcription antitermination protein NusB [Corynebacterium gluta
MSERRQDYKRHGSRYKARMRAVDILFEAESRDVDPVAIIDDRHKLARDTNPIVAPVAEYTETIINGVAVELDTLDVFLAEHIAETWTLGRLPSVDRAILRVASWEMIYNTDVPVTTAIVEAVEIASEYSGDKSSAYINATLDAMASKVETLRERAANPEAVLAEASESLDDAPVAPWDDSDEDFEAVDAAEVFEAEETVEVSEVAEDSEVSKVSEEKADES